MSVRLVRDYVARGILSRPYPKGKEVVFAYEHLVQFLACRYLEEGYALKRIADDIQTSGLDVVLSWIPGEATDRAMSPIDEFKKGNIEPEILESRAELPFDEDASYDEPSLSASALKSAFKLSRTHS